MTATPSTRPESFVVFMSADSAPFARPPDAGGPPGPRARALPLPDPGGVGFVGLPHYAQLSRPWAAVGAMARSLRRLLEAPRRGGCGLAARPAPAGACSSRSKRGCGAGRSCSASARTSPATCAPATHAGTTSGAARFHARGLLARLRTAVPMVAVGPDLARRYRAGRRPADSHLASGRRSTSLRVKRLSPAPYDGELTALSVGRLDPEKNPLLLCRRALEAARARTRVAARRVRRRDDERRAGRAPPRQRQTRTTPSCLGYVSLDSGLRKRYRDSHVFLHVSWTEGVPQVLFESFAAGLPVVATAVGGVPELAAGRSVLIPPGDAVAASEAVLRVATDPRLRAELVDAGLECVKGPFARLGGQSRGGALRADRSDLVRCIDRERHSAPELGMGSASRTRPRGQPRGPGAGRGAARQRLLGRRELVHAGPERHRRGAL